MLLTKKAPAAARDGADARSASSSSPFVHSLRRGLSNALPTMDRRAFLRRSGLGVGVGLAAGQLTLIKKADAMPGQASAIGAGKIEVRRTVCSHC
jgi:formate dehydrogenase major subunit